MSLFVRLSVQARPWVQHSKAGQPCKEWNWVTLKYPHPKYTLLILLTTKRPNAYSKISRLDCACLRGINTIHNVMCWLCVCLVSALSDKPKAQLYGRLVCQVPALVTFINVTLTFISIVANMIFLGWYIYYGRSRLSGLPLKNSFWIIYDLVIKFWYFGNKNVSQIYGWTFKFILRILNILYS